MEQLTVREISKSFDGGEDVLNGLSFAVEKGSFVSVIGSSGAGKTTLFRLLNGALTPDHGWIEIAGKRLSDARGADKRRIQRSIGMVYQDFCLVEQVSCLENVLNGTLGRKSSLAAMLGLFTAEEKNEAARLLEKVGLPDKLSEPVSNLSGGQKQRVAIARALMQHPELILADEPAAALDPVTGAQIIELLKQLQRAEGLTVLMNSHNLELSRAYSDRIIGLKDGAIVFDGSADALNEEAVGRIYSA